MVGQQQIGKRRSWEQGGVTVVWPMRTVGGTPWWFANVRFLEP